MKKITAVFLAVMMVCLMTFSGCSDSKNINAKVEVTKNGETQVENRTIKAKPYGFMNTSRKIDGVEYKVKGWDVFWSIVLIETVVGPILILGLDIMEPVGLLSDSPSNIKIVE